MSQRRFVVIGLMLMAGVSLLVLRPSPQGTATTPAGRAVGYMPTSANNGSATQGLSMPRPESCMTIEGDPDEGEFVLADGLNEMQIRRALDPILPHALKCKPDEGVDMVRLRFGINVGCNGVVDNVWVDDDDGQSASYVECVSSVLAYADFPAHDMPDGMDFEYPVTVSW